MVVDGDRRETEERGGAVTSEVRGAHTTGPVMCPAIDSRVSSPGPAIPGPAVPVAPALTRLPNMPAHETTPSYFRKGFGLKAEVQDALTTDYSGRLVDLHAGAGLPTHRGRPDRAARAGVRLLLRRRAGRRVRVSGTDQVSRPADLPGRGDHSQSARERQARHDGDSVPPSGADWIRFLARRAAGRRDRAGVRRDDRRLSDAAREGRRGRRHDLRLGAQRVEARRQLRARRVHVAHPRQVLPRGDARDRVAGLQVSGQQLSRRSRHG